MVSSGVSADADGGGADMVRVHGGREDRGRAGVRAVRDARG
ncbi:MULTISPECIES: hypothetical protein [unclassified Geodermatophilus]